MVRVIGFAFILLALVAGTAVAQEQDRPARRGGFGGFRGGFGGPGGPQGSGANLLAIPEVQKELGLNDEQKALVDQALNELREQRAGSFNFQEFQDLSEEERQKRFDQMRTRGEELNTKLLETIRSVLEPEQFERFQQLQLQRQGIEAIGSAEVADKLSLSEEQREKVAQIREEARRNMAQGGRGRNFFELSDEERREAFAEMQQQREKVNADLLAVLTPAQQQAWDEMQGEKFEFPQPQFGGGRGVGGGRGPGGGGFGGGRRAGERQRPARKQD